MDKYEITASKDSVIFSSWLAEGVEDELVAEAEKIYPPEKGYEISIEPIEE